MRNAGLIAAKCVETVYRVLNGWMDFSVEAPTSREFEPSITDGFCPMTRATPPGH
jgi:hypothetical protein